MKALLLSGYRDGTFDPGLMNDHISQLGGLGLEVICVLAGAHADDQLRLCPRIANTELVFDTNDHLSLASNTKAGLAATGGEVCFVIPVEVTPPPGDLWRFMKQECWRLGLHIEAPVLQAVDHQGAPWHFGFPLLITHKGNQLIQGLDDFRNLTDARLTYHHLVLD